MSRAIDGAVLTEWISGECKSPSCPKNESAFGMRIIEHIERMSPIEPERKPGHWIIYTVSMLDGEDCKCSECGQISCAPNWRYCPNCGAKMEGVRSDGSD